MRWMGHVCPAPAGQVVAIEGETVRRSYRRGERAVHLVSAYGSGSGVVLGQVRTAEEEERDYGDSGALGCTAAQGGRS